MKPYKDFRDAIGLRESSNKYSVVNSLGFLGRYQFGLARLTDFGICKRKQGQKGFANHCFEWVPPFSQKSFLSSHTLQDTVFDKHVARLAKLVLQKYKLGTTINGIVTDLSGCVACCHLLGPGGLENFFRGKIDKDAFGTKSTDYLTAFSGYDILSIEPQVALASLVVDIA